MPQQTKSRKTKPRGDTQFPGIGRHAKALGVNRASLYRALTGQWDLPGLVKRYNDLLKAES